MMDLNHILKVFLKWWWLLLGAMLLAGVSSYFAVSQQPAVYQARTVLMLGRAFDNPNPSGNELNLGQQLAPTYASIANMSVVREETMAALGLSSLPSYRAQALPNSQLIEIVVTDTSPQRAQAVANELANQLILQSPTAPRPEEQEREAFVDEQLSSLQSNIEETEETIVAKRLELEAAFSARDIERLEREILTLEDKLRTLQGNFAALLANTRSGAINTVSVIEPASLPQRPIGAAGAMTVLTASVIGLVLAAAAALFLDYLDDTVRTEADVAAITDLPVLPGIPDFSEAPEGRRLVMRTDALSLTAETFRALHTAIRANASEEALRTILVTSPRPNEGKSLISANLALTMAQGGYKVLLVDADLRRPMQHRLFGFSNEKGLAQLLQPWALDAEASEIRTRCAELVRPLAEPGLFLLTSGPQKDAYAGTFSFRTIHAILAALAQEFDHVILDSPPLLSLADAVVLGSQVDNVLMIASAGSIRRGDLREAIKRLRETTPHILGIALNRLDPSKNNYYSYYDEYELPEEPQPAANSRDGGFGGDHEAPWYRRVKKTAPTGNR
ncbi:MAG: polysaccharide biosynthesis tyrosine autokinase [Anaerolineae bacterium]|nr:polysaccharide biosynthesis tyrosine autokinase [Anaerolineae bacterium]